MRLSQLIPIRCQEMTPSHPVASDEPLLAGVTRSAGGSVHLTETDAPATIRPVPRITHRARSLMHQARRVAGRLESLPIPESRWEKSSPVTRKCRRPCQPDLPWLCHAASRQPVGRSVVLRAGEAPGACLGSPGTLLSPAHWRSDDYGDNRPTT